MAERDLQIKQLREEVKTFQEKYQVAMTKERFVGSNININVAGNRSRSTV